MGHRWWVVGHYLSGSLGCGVTVGSPVACSAVMELLLRYMHPPRPLLRLPLVCEGPTLLPRRLFLLHRYSVKQLNKRERNEQENGANSSSVFIRTTKLTELGFYVPPNTK